MDGTLDRDRNPLEFGRLLSLSDSIFAVAMTLLVISIALPVGMASGEFRDALGGLLPRFAIMALSIVVAASAWLAHHRFFGMVQRVDNGLVGLNIVFLGLVAFVPFPHQVLGNYSHEPLAYVLYAAVLGSINALAVVMDVYVRRRGLLRVAQSEGEFRLELARGVVAASGFLLSIPLAFVLVAWTPAIWLLVLPLDRLLALSARRTAVASAADAQRSERPRPDGEALGARRP